MVLGERVAVHGDIGLDPSFYRAAYHRIVIALSREYNDRSPENAATPLDRRPEALRRIVIHASLHDSCAAADCSQGPLRISHQALVLMYGPTAVEVDEPMQPPEVWDARRALVPESEPQRLVYRVWLQLIHVARGYYWAVSNRAQVI